jgi:putative oxidoreductase
MLTDIYLGALRWLDRQAGLLPLAARLVFAGVLAVYFWASASTKLDAFPFDVSLGAYAQIFPRAFEAAGYNLSAMGVLHKIVILAGAYAEYLLPLLIVIGLVTRLAALGMIGFVIVQSATDIWGHNAAAATIGTWFDRDSAALIADQRALWVVLLMILVLRGAGALSVDRWTAQRLNAV